jgi:hypothetical protein
MRREQADFRRAMSARSGPQRVEWTKNIPADSIVTYGVKLAGIKSLYINGKIGKMGRRKGRFLAASRFVGEKPVPSRGEAKRLYLNFVTD